MRSEVGSLMQMAATAVGRSQVPWRAILHDLTHEGEDHKNCLAILEDNVGSYVISPPVTRRSHRPSQKQKGKTIWLTTATLIIVPQNLLSQWKDEISLHVEDQFLQVLYLSSDATPVPSAAKLMKYDVILMSRQRFEREIIPKGTAKARFKSNFKGMYITSGFPFSGPLHRTMISWGCLIIPSSAFSQERKADDPKQ